MDRRVNYAMVGAFVLVLGFMLLASVVWLSSFRHGEEYSFYKMFAREDVSGLSVGSSVRFSGVQVGSVVSISINPKDVQEVKIVLKIQRSTPITTSTVASLVTEGITGVQFIGLKALKPKAPLLLSTKDNPEPVIPDRPSLFVRLGGMLDTLALNVSELTQDIKKVVSQKNRDSLEGTLDHLNKFSGVLDKNSLRLASIIDHLDSVMKQADAASQSLPETMHSVNEVVASMKQVSKQATQVLSNTDMVTRELSRSAMPDLDQVLKQSSQIMDNLRTLTDRVRENPAVLLRGQQPMPGGPGE